jgi:stage IV sporulation protein FB
MNAGILRFNVLGFPVSVEPWFWIVAIFLGIQLPPRFLPIWIAAVFVSVLVHELGHAVVSRAYGCRTHIQLYSFGGLTFSDGGGRLSHKQRILLSLAGPFAGFGFAAIVYAFDAWVLAPAAPAGTLPGLAATAAFFLIYINFYWGLINLLPVLPLDGGHVMESLVHSIKGPRARELPLQISLGVAGAVAVYFLMQNRFFPAMLFGWMAFDAYNALQSRIRPRYPG